MLTLKQVLIGTLVFALYPTFAEAFEDTAGLTAQVDQLRAAERSSRDSGEAIAALEAAYFDLNLSRADAIARLSENADETHQVVARQLEQARAQLKRARAAVKRRLDEIAIEGAEKVEIGGEIRASRMVVARWERVVDIVAGNLAQVRREIARIESDRCDQCDVREIATGDEVDN